MIHYYVPPRFRASYKVITLRPCKRVAFNQPSNFEIHFYIFSKFLFQTCTSISACHYLISRSQQPSLHLKMADVDMPDAGPAAPAKTKANTKTVKGGAADTAADGRKRFEVKKVCEIHPRGYKQVLLTQNSGMLLHYGPGISWLTTVPSVGIISWISVRHQLLTMVQWLLTIDRHRVSGKSRLGHQRRVHSRLGHLQCIFQADQVDLLS